MANENFMQDVKDQMVKDPDAKYNVSVTENGALGYATTGSKFVDAMFSLPEFRRCDEEHVKHVWRDLYYEDMDLAILFLFYVGDIRGGAGERDTFRSMFKAFCEIDPIAKNFICYISYYSRWDIVLDLLGINDSIDDTIVDIVKMQFYHDIDVVVSKKNESISLLAKWLPSYNTSSYETKKKAILVAKKCFNLDLVNPSDQKTYRKMISTVRKALKLTETAMASNKWTEIDYSAVPSKAILKYKNAFNKHDPSRYHEYLEKVANGEEKINASVAYPSDIVYKYIYDHRTGLFLLDEEDLTLEEMWKALPQYDFGDKDILAVVDGSGSMLTHVGKGTKMNALSVAFSLGIYFADHNHGPFKDTFITFSHDPHIVKFNEGSSLKKKIDRLLEEDDINNTNVEKVFELILDTAIKNDYKQEDLPGAICVITDMEFDLSQSVAAYNYYPDFSADFSELSQKRLFDEIADRYNKAGYKLPKVIFWNVNSRTNTIPICENELGVSLVSGYSTHILKMVLSNQLDPFELVKETLMSDRYSLIKTELDSIKEELESIVEELDSIKMGND